MKKYKVYKNGMLLESYSRRYEAEAAIRKHQHNERLQSHRDLSCVPCNNYEIRR